MKKTLIIAEAGVNHNGDIAIAKKLIDVAVDAGVDYVKFQTFKTENVISRVAKKAAYQIANTGKEEESQFDMVKKLELNREKHQILIDYCNQRGIKFLSTAFDLESIDLLDDLGIDLYKIPSGEITNIPFLKKIASKNKPVILSTGMANLGEIESAIEILYAGGINSDMLTVLHCNTEYPTPMHDVNLSAMITISNAFNVTVGYSDHTLGIEVPTAAVALGAVCIEKHFTLDKTMEGPDHQASLEPDELSAMVKAIRNIEQAMGSGIKKASESERKNITIARKSLHLAHDVMKGHVISERDLILIRPGDGLEAKMTKMIVGRKVRRAMKAYEKLSLDSFC